MFKNKIVFCLYLIFDFYVCLFESIKRLSGQLAFKIKMIIQWCSVPIITGKGELERKKETKKIREKGEFDQIPECLVFSGKFSAIREFDQILECFSFLHIFILIRFFCCTFEHISEYQKSEFFSFTFFCYPKNV